MACPELLTTLAYAPYYARYNGAGDTIVSADGSFWRFLDYATLVSTQGVSSGTVPTHAWGMSLDAYDSTYLTINSSINRYRDNPHPESGLWFLAGIFSVEGIQPGSNRPVTFAGDKLYVLANGNASVGQRLLRFDLLGNLEARVFEFDRTLYDSTITSQTGIECYDGVIYGLLHGASNNAIRYGFAYNIATDTATVQPVSTGLVAQRGVHHDGCGIYNTDLNTYVRMYPDATVEALGCADLDNSLNNIHWLTTDSRADLGKTLYNVRYNTGATIEYRLYEESPVAGLDVPTLTLDGLRVPYRRLPDLEG